MKEIEKISNMSGHINMSTEIKRYVQNIVVFLRMHRAVAGGVSPLATRHFELLIKCLAPLHSLEYATPSLVALAARKVYRHRLSLVREPRNERSMQYGSNVVAVAKYLESINAEEVIEEVLLSVEPPL